MSTQAIQQKPVIVLTRPELKAKEFSERLGGMDVELIRSPAIQIEKLNLPEPLTNNALLVFSSQNAVQSVLEQERLDGFSGYCVGHRTAQMLADGGLRVLASAQDAKSLLAKILADGPRNELIHLCGNHVAVDIAKLLSKAGLNARAIMVYAQHEIPPKPELIQSLDGAAAHIFPLCSPRTAQIVSRQLANIRCHVPIHLVSISQAVDKAWDGPKPASRCHAAKPDAPSMIAKIRQTVASLT